MKVLADTTWIDAPPEDVFEFFHSMDEERYLAWHEEHLAFQFEDGDHVETGARAYFEEEIGDEHLESTVRYTAVRPPAYIEFRDEGWVTRLFNPKNTFAFEAKDGGTRFEATVHLRVGPLERLSASVRRDLAEVRRHMREEGKNLKRLVESGAIETNKPA